MRKRRWMNAVASPRACRRPATAAACAANGFTPATISAAHRQPPSGKLPSLVRSGKGEQAERNHHAERDEARTAGPAPASPAPGSRSWRAISHQASSILSSARWKRATSVSTREARASPRRRHRAARARVHHQQTIAVSGSACCMLCVTIRVVSLPSVDGAQRGLHHQLRGLRIERGSMLVEQQHVRRGRSPPSPAPAPGAGRRRAGRRARASRVSSPRP